ncbi:hypothetical protein [Vibrio splendidus]|uniref:hypothetical protein n=1 Tax=Vibrio splendidus TaxID=29497 RepID=UPI001ABF0F4B|nr:hypothetical protein [Vibrio splendidus]
MFNAALNHQEQITKNKPPATRINKNALSQREGVVLAASALLQRSRHFIAIH